MPVTVHPAGRRFHTRGPGLDTWHSFSFGTHYDAGNVGFGPMLCHNDERLRPGSGYSGHRHRDVEIVTWVVQGTLSHDDCVAGAAVLPAGTVQVLSAGAGVVHSETVAASAAATRFLQVWIRPDAPGGSPSRAAAAVGDALAAGGWVPVVGPDPRAPLRVGAAGARLVAALLPCGARLVLPERPRQHLFLASGAVRAAGFAEPWTEGDAARLVGVPPLELTATRPAHVLVWSFEDPPAPGILSDHSPRPEAIGPGRPDHRTG